MNGSIWHRRQVAAPAIAFFLLGFAGLFWGGISGLAAERGSTEDAAREVAAENEDPVADPPNGAIPAIDAEEIEDVEIDPLPDVALPVEVAVEAEAEGDDAGEMKAEEDADDEMAADDSEDEDNEEKDDAEKPGKANANWLSDLIKKALQPGGANPPGKPRVNLKDPAAGGPNAAANAKARKSRHPFDARAPYDKKTDAWMRKAVGEIKAGQWKQALNDLQKISEQPEDSLYRTDDGKWISIRAESQRRHGQAPPELLDAYRKEYGGLARQMLAEAIQGNDVSDYGRVITRYFHTEAGYEAMNRLGSLHLDRGEFGLAARCFAALWEAGAPVTRESAWRVKAALACRNGGEPVLADELLGELKPAAKPVELGGTPRDAGEWLGSVARLTVPVQEALSEWLTFFGNSRRTGVAAGSAPLLLPRWNQATTQSNPVRTQLEYMVEDLSDQGSTPLPMTFPTMVGGKVVFRTLQGVQVVDAASGRPLWETPDSVPVEMLLSSGSNPNVLLNGRMRFQVQVRFNRGFFNNNNGFVNQYSAGSAEYHPLCNLLFRNGNFGLVSSDGQQLFVLDDPTILSPRQPGQNWNDSSATEADTGANKLTAYDLASGRPLWEIGGQRYEEPLDLPLAGYFFFGPPVADGGELFVVGESLKEKEIRLLALEPQTGRLKWSQSIAVSEAQIDKDIGRRWWPAQVAAGNGVLVCPTTVGWLVAIDRASRSLLWGHRVGPANPANANEQNDAVALVQSAPLNARWSTAPPVIVGNRVISTPQESQFLFCLDLVSGKELWRKPRGEMLYLAGVFEDRAIVVGREAVTAFAVADGAQAWSVKTAVPSGRGVAVAGHYYLPLASGELWDLDLAAGKVLGKSFLPEGSRSLGNLAMYRGMLLSLNAFGMTAFEQRDAIQAEITQRKKQNPRDPWALLREAEISALNRDVAAALASLRQIPRAELPPDLVERYRKLFVETLTAGIRSDLARPQAETDLKELEALVQEPAERLQFRRLLAERHGARKEYAESFAALLALAEERTELLVPLNDESEVRVRGDLWLAGKFVDLWPLLPEPLRAELDGQVAARAAAVLKQPIEAQLQMVTLFGFHPATAGVKRALADDYAKRGELLPAEHLLLELQASSDPPTAASATERLARLMIEFKQPADAAWFYDQLAQNFGSTLIPDEKTAVPNEKAGVPEEKPRIPDEKQVPGEKTVAADGKTGAEIVKALRDAGTYPRDPAAEATFQWKDQELKMERMGANFTNAYLQDLSGLGSRLPFFKNHRLQLPQQEQRFEVIDAATQETYWSLPLRSKAGSTDGLLSVGQSSGHHVALLHRGVLHSISPIDRKVLWTRTLENRLGTQGFFAGTNQNPVPAMQPALGLSNRLSLSQGMGAFAGMLGLANRKIICYQGRRSITVLDTLSGEVRWTYEGVRPGTLLYGNEDVIYLRSPDTRPPVALRVLDGKRLDVAKLGELLAQAIQITGSGLVLHKSAPGAGAASAQKSSLRLFDPLRGKELWTVEFPRNTKMSLLDAEHLAFLEPTGNLQRIDLRTGAVRLLGTVPAADFKRQTEVFVLADYERTYLIVNGAQSPNYYSEGLPFIRASGMLFAFDSEGTKPVWKQKVTGQNLILERLEHSPILLFASRRFEQKGKLRYAMLNIMALDKVSGTKLIDQNTASQSGFRSLLINSAEHYVELRSYNERIRLSPVEKTAAVSGPPQ